MPVLQRPELCPDPRGEVPAVERFGHEVVGPCLKALHDGIGPLDSAHHDDGKCSPRVPAANLPHDRTAVGAGEGYIQQHHGWEGIEGAVPLAVPLLQNLQAVFSREGRHDAHVFLGKKLLHDAVVDAVVVNCEYLDGGGRHTNEGGVGTARPRARDRADFASLAWWRQWARIYHTPRKTSCAQVLKLNSLPHAELVGFRDERRAYLRRFLGPPVRGVVLATSHSAFDIYRRDQMSRPSAPIRPSLIISQKISGGRICGRGSNCSRRRQGTRKTRGFSSRLPTQRVVEKSEVRDHKAVGCHKYAAILYRSRDLCKGDAQQRHAQERHVQPGG
mmetsp:Transcript_23058/g.64043  ORF Transcript_23058/g.64043 Transcript_23058/m.64043 type:complete len:331 (+) Transcript_23058:1243-2235(+)